jgi:hypothetical protein
MKFNQDFVKKLIFSEQILLLMLKLKGEFINGR